MLSIICGRQFIAFIRYEAKEYCHTFDGIVYIRRGCNATHCGSQIIQSPHHSVVIIKKIQKQQIVRLIEVIFPKEFQIIF